MKRALSMTDKFDMKGICHFVIRCADLVLMPFTLLSAPLLRFLRPRGIKNPPASRLVFRPVGLLPIRDHYYEPLFNPKYIRRPLDDARDLPGIDLNLPAQLELLEQFAFQTELLRLEDKQLEDGVPPFRY